MVTGILDGLRWLGIDWDEGPGVGGPHAPYFQIASGCAALPRRRDGSLLGGAAQALRRRAARIRFKVPPGKTTFSRRGARRRSSSTTSTSRDFVILRSDTPPDLPPVGRRGRHRHGDHARRPRRRPHLEHAEAGAALPGASASPRRTFAHVPLIMGPDKKRLSKRHGATSVMEYEKQGYLPEAMFNFLALLGWGTGSDDELFTKDELVARFALEGISGGNAVFNTEKLDWFNHQHLLGLPDEELVARLDAWLARHGSWPAEASAKAAGALGSQDPTWLSRVLALLRPRCKKLTDYADQLAPFFVDPASYDAGGVKKHLGAPEMPGHLSALREAYAALPEWSEAALEQSLRALAEARGVKAGALIHGTRLAMTGRMVSPGLFEMLVLLGRDRVLGRLDRLIESLSR